MRVSEYAEQADTETAADDLAVVERARADRRAFAPLYHRYAEPVYRFCYRRLGHPDAAADATGQVVTRALAGLDGFRGGSFRAWLFAIAHNAVLDDLRRRRPDLPIDAALDVQADDPDGAPEPVAIAGDQRRELLAALTQLPDDQRGIVEMRLAGLKGPEIAEALGRSHAAIKSSQFRAYARLRQILRVEPGPEETTNAS